MIAERLKEIGLKISDLSNYFKLSRPTIYKFIGYYDQNKLDLVNKNVLQLFEFIKKNPNVGKDMCIKFILNDIAYINEDERFDDYIKEINTFKTYLSNDPKYLDLISYIIKSRTLDNVLDYLLEVFQILEKGIDVSSADRIAPLFNLIKEISIE